MIIGDMEIRLRADIARLQRDMDSARQVVGNATAGMERAANAAKGAIASIAAGLGAQELGRMVDEYAKFTAQLKLASSSQREYAAAYADVKRISTVAAQGLQETGVLYARIANGTRELGVAQKQVAAITETVNLSLLVSGATASEAASAQMQLSQAFASGTLRGEEFNAVNEAAPRLMLALADGIGVPVGALKKMAEEGQITSKIMSDVLPNALGRLREEAKEVQTISGAFTVLRNNMMEFVGIQANASGVVSALTQAITGLSDNLATVGTAIVAITAIKLAFWLDAVATKTLAASIASTTHRNATAASAQATAASTAAEVRNLQARAAMIVELRAETMATLAATNAVINSTASDAAKTLAMQSRSVASAELAALGRLQVTVDAALVTSTGAAAAATTALTATTWRAAIAAKALAAATWAIANPLASITLALGVGATAWMWWSNRAQEANDKVAASTEETTTEMIGRLDKQIEKLKERNKLQSEEPRVQKLGQLSDADEQGLARAKAALDAVRSGSGQWANQPLFKRQLAEIDLANEYETALLRLKQAQDEVGAAATRTRDARVGEWYAQNGTNAQKLAAELAKLRQQFGTIPPEMEKMVRAKYVDKGSAQAVKQEATAYQNLTTSIREKFAANELELSGYDKLAESQKMTIKLDEAIASGKNKLTPAHVAETRALIAKVAAQESAIEEGAFYLQQSEQQAQLSAAAIKAADDEADRNEELARTFGMSKVAIEQMTLARLEEKLAQADTSKGYTREIAELEAVIDAKRRSVVAISQVDQMETSKKAAEQAAEDWKRAGEDINRSLTDALLRGFESGKSFGKNLVDTLKNMFSTLVLRPVISAALSPLSAGLTGSLGLAGNASAATGAGGGAGSIGSLASLANGASSLYGSLTGGATLAGGVGTGFLGSLAGGLNGAGMGSGLTSALGMNIGNGIASVVGPNVASGIASGLSGLAAAAPWVAGALAVYTIGKKAFGRGPKEYTGDQTLNGSIGASGFAGTMDADWVKKGGWFRSDKEGSDKNPVNAEVAAGLTSAYDAIKTTSADFARALGINADSIATRTQAIKIAMGKDEAANQKAIADFFTGVANTVAGELLPEIAKFQAQGEEASSTLQRLAVNFTAMDQILVVMGTTSKAAFGAVGTASLEARERLLGFAGGIDALATQATFFNQNFLSQAEQIAIIQKPLTEQLTALGYAGLTTSDQFKVAVQGLVESGALATERGAEQYAGLLALGPQFKVFADYLKEVGDAAKATALEEENRVRQLGLDKLQLSIQIMELEGNALGALTARRAQELSSVDESLRPHYRRIYALQDEKTAMEAATQAAQAARDTAAALMSNVDSSFSVMQKVVEREKRALQEEIAVRTQSVQSIQSLSAALRGSLAGMSPAGQEAEDRRTARSQIQDALAIAKASGVLPDADSLSGALSVLGKDSANQFATQQEYLRDFYTTRRGIEDLAGITDNALSIEERSLQKLEDQVTQYDQMLEQVQEQIDIAKGERTVNLSIEQTLQAVLGALRAANANPINSANAAISQAYQSSLGRAPDAAGLEYWQGRAAGGISTDAIVGSIKNSPEAQLQALYKDVLGRPADAAGLSYWMERLKGGIDLSAIRQTFVDSEEKKARVPGFASGGDHAGGWRLVGENGPELEATGPARIFNTSQTQGMMRRLASPQENGAALAAAVDRLNATVERQAGVIERQGAALDQIQRNTRRQADTIDVLTEGGKAMRTKEQTS